MSKIIASGSREDRNRAGYLLATLHFSAPARAQMLHADPHPGNFRLMPDGRLGVVDFGAVARLPDGHPEPVGRLTRLALAKDADGVLAGLREEGFIKGDQEIDAQMVLDFLLPMLEPISVDEFQFTRAWLRAEAARLSSPKSPGVPAQPAAEPATVVPVDPPGHPRLDRGAVPTGGQGAVSLHPGALAARLRPRPLDPRAHNSPSPCGQLASSAQLSASCRGRRPPAGRVRAPSPAPTGRPAARCPRTATAGRTRAPPGATLRKLAYPRRRTGQLSASCPGRRPAGRARRAAAAVRAHDAEGASAPGAVVGGR